MTKEARTYNGKKITSAIHGAEKLGSRVKRIKPDHFLIPWTKINSKLKIQMLNLKSQVFQKKIQAVYSLISPIFPILFGYAFLGKGNKNVKKITELTSNLKGVNIQNIQRIHKTE